VAIHLYRTDPIKRANIAESPIIATRRDVGALKELTAAEWLGGAQEGGVQFGCGWREIRPKALW